MRKNLLFAILVTISGALQAQKTKIQDLFPIIDSLRKTEVVRDFVEKTFKPKSGDVQTEIEQPISLTNFTQNVIEAEGTVFLNPQHIESIGYEYALEMATVGAEVEARANLLAEVLGATIYDTVTVIDKMLQGRVTLQTIEGTVRARKVGETILNGKAVKVTMQCDRFGAIGSLYEMINTNNLEPEGGVVFSNEEQEDMLNQILELMIAAGLLPEGTTEIPPIVIELPQEQMEQYNTSMYPTLVLKSPDGTTHEIILNDQMGVTPQAAEIIVNSAELLQATGALENVLRLKGEVKDGRIEVEMPKLFDDKDEKQKRRAERWNKIGKTAMELLPIALMFL